MKPGITGLAQVSGRNLLDAREKWALDARYAETANLMEDFRILARTVWKVVAREGIHREG